MPNDNQARTSASIKENGSYPIDLTGPHSHTLVIRPGVGSLSIGPSHFGKKVDLHVSPDASIDWSVFEDFATPAGSPWPRFLYYSGSDTGFIDWAKTRPIEEMTWAPALTADTLVDATQSIIHSLHVELNPSAGHLNLILPKELSA